MNNKIMKYLKKFNESTTDITEYVEMMMADITDYNITLTVDENDGYIVIKLKMDNIHGEFIDINLVLDKVNQVISQLDNYEIDMIDLYKLTSKGIAGQFEQGYSSYKLSKNLSIKEIARKQGFTGTDKLKNLNKYIDRYNCESIYIYLNKTKSYTNKIKKFFKI